MRVSGKKIAGIFLLLGVLLLSSWESAPAQSPSVQSAPSEQQLPEDAPDLSEIVPLAAQLSGRLADLENRMKRLQEIFTVEKKLDVVNTNLKDTAGQLQRLKDAKDYRYFRLVELAEAVKQENKLLEEISRPVHSAIYELGAWRKEWLAEKKQWRQWQLLLLEEQQFDLLVSIFNKATQTIDKALAVIGPQLEVMLTLQEKAGRIQTKTIALAAELEGLTADKRRRALLSESPPMFSSGYFAQFGSGLWHASQKGLDELLWQARRFFQQQGWAMFLQGIFTIFVTVAIFRNRQVLGKSAHWRFLIARPVSAGLFLVFITTLCIYEYRGAPAFWKYADMAVAGITYARLSGVLVETSWRRHFVYGLIAALISIRLLEVLGLPLPLFRIYTVVTALVGLLCCLRWTAESRRQKEPGMYAWLLRLGSLIFAIIVVTELWGKDPLPLYLLASLIDSIATVLVFQLLMYLIRGGLQWLFRSSLLQRAAVLQGDTGATANRVARFIDAVIWSVLLVPAFLVIWGVYDGLEEAIKGMLSLGINLGAQRISVGLLLVSAGILYGAFLVSRVLQKVLMDVVLVKRQAERGVRHSIARLVHYAVVTAGFLLAISILGFEITKITIMLSALGVGIGFGLQGVVNNFVSGLILLFEGPVRVGDTIEIEGTWSEIKKIGLRATTVETFEQADLIIPNADLVSNQVINWTLSNRRVRLTVPVGVAYGSNVDRVVETLMACAGANSLVVKVPAPQVLFLRFGESSLDFELRVWVLDVDYRLKAKSELHHEIDRRFREAKIEIAFPQRDLHIRTAVPQEISR
jgi:small-conductance mechanosensitive channel